MIAPIFVEFGDEEPTSPSFDTLEALRAEVRRLEQRNEDLLRSNQVFEALNEGLKSSNRALAARVHRMETYFDVPQ